MNNQDGENAAVRFVNILTNARDEFYIMLGFIVFFSCATIVSIVCWVSTDLTEQCWKIEVISNYHDVVVDSPTRISKTAIEKTQVRLRTDITVLYSACTGEQKPIINSKE